MGCIVRSNADLEWRGRIGPELRQGSALQPREPMMLRIIHGKLKPGTWDSYERPYEDVMTKAGKITGLRGRWLARAVDDPDAGYTLSLRENESAMRAYEIFPAEDSAAAAQAVLLGGVCDIAL
jgi:hypothetical protein